MKKSKKIAITGALGSIGSILMNDLKDRYNLVGIDKQRSKACLRLNLATDTKALRKAFTRCDVVVHLAWDNREDFPNLRIVPENKTIAENVYREALRAGVKRIIIASSVHANDYRKISKGNMVPSSSDTPDTPYGASKIYIESLGRFYAANYGLEVICIRFGGLNPKNEIRLNEDPLYDKVLLYREDAIDLLIKCIDRPKMKHKFTLLYAVSNNKGRIHSTKNDLDWKPRLP
ncbi:MAG: NAD(P)-dependent oxidoreductase [Candidatus Komeilibacteria bacterium]